MFDPETQLRNNHNTYYQLQIRILNSDSPNTWWDSSMEYKDKEDAIKFLTYLQQLQISNREYRIIKIKTTRIETIFNA